MIGKISKVRHAAVVAAVGGTSALAGFGVIGGTNLPERFDAKTVVVAREGGESLRIAEYVDIDFGSAQRHGYERIIPNDFGVPTDVVASSPDANDEVSVVDLGSTTRIRIGNPDITFTGQHRYELSYTYPDARLDVLGLDLDIVAPLSADFPGDQETGRFEVIVTGFELSGTRCDVGGSVGDVGGCELVDAGDGTYRAVIEPLEEGVGLTIGGAIAAVTEPADIPVPPIPERRDGGPNRGLIALGFAGLGAAGSIPVYRWARRKGRNEVYAGGAVDAAHGSLPPPGSAPGAPPPVTLVADDDLHELATIEFVPPKGIEPWEAHVLLTERCGDDAVEAWLSSLVAHEALDVEQDKKNLKLSSGPRRGELPDADAKLLTRILQIDDPYVTGEYDKRFAKAWTAIHKHQVKQIERSSWWNNMTPGSPFDLARARPYAIMFVFFFIMLWSGALASAFIGLLGSWPIAIAVGLTFPALVAYMVYRVMLPARSAQGSALALQAESFRRFLHASEGRHVEWAWDQGLLREYSAWAVALGEADAWSKALDRANVPAPARAAAGPIIVHTGGSSMRTSRTAPSSSGGSGGFSGGGGVGGGGGGGSSGSW